MYRTAPPAPPVFYQSPLPCRFTSECGNSAGHTRTGHSRMSEEPTRTLIVDDLDANRRLLVSLLRSLGHVPETAADGVEALEKLSLGFDLILLDVTMPGMDGFEVTRHIRQDPTHRDVPIIIVTAMDGREERLRAVEAGANDFIAKPVDFAELKIRTRSVLNVKAAQDALKQHQAQLEELVEQRTAALRQALDEMVATQERMLEAEREKKRFYGDVLRAVTEDKLLLTDAADLVAEGRLVAEEPLEAPEACRRLRDRLEVIALEAGIYAEGADDLVLAAGEAAANAIKHAGAGHAAVYLSDQYISVQIRDEGRGIQLDALPSSLLIPGFSTKISLGMGFTIMLRVLDRLRLATGPEGTVVQLEKAIQPKTEQNDLLLSLMDRF